MTDNIVTLFAKPAAPSGRKTPGPFDENAYQRGWRDAVEYLAAMPQGERAWRSASLDDLTLDELEQERQVNEERRVNLALAIFFRRRRTQQEIPQKRRRASRSNRKPRLAIVKSDAPVPAA